MKTFIEIGEFLANPFVAGILFTVLALPAFWGIARLIQWMKTHCSDIFKTKKHLYK